MYSDPNFAYSDPNFADPNFTVTTLERLHAAGHWAERSGCSRSRS